MDIRLHFVRKLIQLALIKLHYVKTTENIANFLTKALGRATIRKSLAAIGILQVKEAASNLTPRSTPGCWKPNSRDRDSNPKRARTQQKVYTAVIDHKQSTNVIEPAMEPNDSTNPNRSSLLDRLSSPIAPALFSKNLVSEPIDKSLVADNYNNQTTSLYPEENKETSAHRITQQQF
ncbi:hypothetical protein PGT21_050236 [Puccinia graminis f. sp. tritici]|uniref:Uncharacterized protein n=1 Tax=Puccinia graminis f. sp. tritici TaxID=56615 RepID=A0A5B0MMH0_PUCGR|nr:hypothetical protein PGTUg99_050021 [Puccinia graminis f. sp. tritici]KAA1090899.1 hypothetical protein PGT21_050236 [Puccinia graminis f. sp. tritici]